MPPVPYRQQMLGFRTADDDSFTVVPGLVHGAEVIAVGKSPRSTMPVHLPPSPRQRHGLRERLDEQRLPRQRLPSDYGGWEYDFILALPIETSGITDVDITRGAALWLRNSWGYFWNQK